MIGATRAENRVHHRLKGRTPAFTRPNRLEGHGRRDYCEQGNTLAGPEVWMPCPAFEGRAVRWPNASSTPEAGRRRGGSPGVQSDVVADLKPLAIRASATAADCGRRARTPGASAANPERGPLGGDPLGATRADGKRPERSREKRWPQG